MNTSALQDALAVGNRADILSVCSGTPLTRSEIVDRVDRSRATVYRATTALEQKGFLERTPDGFRTTQRGAVVLEATNRFLDSVTATDRLEPLLMGVSSRELAANAHHLIDAELVVATETDPYVVTDRAMDLWETTDQLRFAIPAIGTRDSVVRGTTAIRNSGMDVEMCLTPTVLSTFRNLSPDLLDEIIAAENVAIQVSEGIPFSFGLHDDEVATVGANDETGIATVLAISDAPDARRWLDGLFERCWSRGAPVEEFLE
ncbi:helix-turn-helix transcriptional regulator [Natrarchaeobius sp. A-rgal3]|uniref:helix-turn-helix transcriptional regulator n=1 Tax=Natrarchaeobius versutus TaxID=1679078 RepID=UPI00350F7CBA